MPNRVKVLLWRAGLDALPSLMNLVKRMVNCDPICPSCGLEQETTFHALWSCSALVEVWSFCFASLIRQTRMCSNFLDIIQVCCSRSESLDMFATISSFIWTRRNRLRVGEIPLPLQKINSLACDSLQEFQEANLLPCGPSPSPFPVKWSPPPVSWMKVNFDGVLFKETDFAGLGVIIGNDLGQVMAVSAQVIPLPTSVETVEVLAARNAICLARELQLHKVIIEGDSEVVIKALNSSSASSTSFGHIICDIKITSAAFSEIKFCHTRRQGNLVAHSIARRACNFSPFIVWMEDVPPDILSMYSSELVE